MAAEKEAKEKPLEKMTAKDLREIAKQITDLVGVHGMNKGDLIAAIKESRGIKEEPGKRALANVREIKGQIKALKVKRAEALQTDERKKSAIFRRKIARLKKKTRQTA